MVMKPALAIDDPGEPFGARSSHGQALPAGTYLRDYEITGLIVEGGFAIVYQAWDHSLQRKVAIKEYLPASMAGRVAGTLPVVVRSERRLDVFRAGLKSFVNEARLLARFDHASLVKVYRFWEENGTAYMVMPFYEGPTLKAALAELGHVPGEAELRAWLKPILNAVTLLHEAHLWHQNIGPDGIVLTPVGPVLFGFGAAEHTIAALDHTPAAALKAGFAAIEQYGSAAETTRGAWTDLYALAAVVYAAITGSPPAPAADRLAEDPVRPLSAIAAGLYSESFLAAVDAALAVEPDRRPRDHLQFRSLMGDFEASEPLELAPPPDLMHEPFVGSRAGEREITVPDRPLMSLGDGAAKPGVRPAAPAMARATPGERGKAPARASNDGAPPRMVAGSSSWMPAAALRRIFGKRALYGLVAGTFALIGVAALALQFYARQSAHPVGALPAVAPPALPASATTPPETIAAPAPAAPVVVQASRRPGAPASAPVVLVTPRPTVMPAPAATPQPVAATVPAASPPPPVVIPPTARAGSPPGAAPAAPLVPQEDLSPPATAAERQARCTEILQKASLERITAAETSFFKRECK